MVKAAELHYPRIPREYWEHHIVIDLGEDKAISGVSYLPRPESGKPVMIKDYKIYLKKTPFKLAP